MYSQAHQLLPCSYCSVVEKRKWDKSEKLWTEMELHLWVIAGRNTAQRQLYPGRKQKPYQSNPLESVWDNNKPRSSECLAVRWSKAKLLSRLEGLSTTQSPCAISYKLTSRLHRNKTKQKVVPVEDVVESWASLQVCVCLQMDKVQRVIWQSAGERLSFPCSLLS